MIKQSAFLLILLATSCGKYETSVGTTQRIGKSLELSTLTSSDKNNLTTICNALAEKELILPGAIGSTLTFATTQTDCNGTQVSAENAEVVISNGNLLKRRSDSLDFIFPNVETSKVGLFETICKDLANNQTFNNPRPIQGLASNITASNIAPAECPPATGELCFQANISDGRGKVITKEWVRFRINSILGKVGFFTYRMKMTQGTCPENKFMTYTATLK